MAKLRCGVKIVAASILSAFLGSWITYHVTSSNGQRVIDALNHDIEMQEERITNLNSEFAEKVQTMTNLEADLSENLTSIIETIRVHPVPIDEVPLQDYLENDPSQFMFYVKDPDNGDWKLPINTGHYFRLKRLSYLNASTADFARFVTPDDHYIKLVTNHLTRDIESKETYSQNILDFVHKYVIYDDTIEKNGQYVKYPIETLVEANGDCEDLALLSATLMKAAGMDVALIRFDRDPKDPESSPHLGVGVYGDFSGFYFNLEGKKYYYAEPTATKWRSDPSMWNIGEMPEPLRNRKAQVILLN